MKKWLRDMLGITKLEKENAALRKEVQSHREYVVRKVEELKDYTRVDVDAGFRGDNTIILTGVYRNKGYVRFYDLPDEDFRAMVDQLKHMRSHALIRNIDSLFDFRGTFDL